MVNRNKLVFALGLVVLIGGLMWPQSVSASETSSKRIVVSIKQEKLTAYEGNKIVLQTPVTTGGPMTPTPAGTFRVLEKRTNFVMRSRWPKSDKRWYPDSFVRYALLYQNNGYFIHDASWRRRFGVGSNLKKGIPGGSFTGTHGCINVPLTAERKLFNWADVGTIVVVN
jgi:lipoprotein-anchoring transpeptidase ErfK/SrfK